MNGLMMFKGSPRVSREELKYISTPMSTHSWKPVPHYEIAEMIADEAKARNFDILSEEYGLNPAGTKMFGVLRFQPDGHPEYARALGIRNSNDKQLALGMTAGVSVFVCENLCFHGTSIVYRKHTSGIRLREVIPEAFDRIELQYAALDVRITTLKSERVSINEARITVVMAAEIRAIPSCDIIEVLEEFREPRHEEFSLPNKWSLYNSFTETAKKYSPARADKCYRGLAQIFDLK
jgi:hypothetical protein